MSEHWPHEGARNEGLVTERWRPPRNDTEHPGILGNSVRTCGYCGSMHPDDVMRGLRDGSFMLGGTDKNYKSYIERTIDADTYTTKVEAEMERERQVHAKAAVVVTDDELRTIVTERSWLTHGETVGKFYFEHLDADQRQEIIDGLNAGTISHSLYVLPFFCKATT